MIEGLSHMTFIVRDLDKMARILTEILGGVEVYDSGEDSFSIAAERFFDVNGLWIAIQEGDPLYERSYNHVAFKVKPGDMDACRKKIEALGLDIRAPRPRIEGEGQSIYFHDYDNHLFELHSGTLNERLRSYAQAAE
ncbi:FosX/FosE/FosI family fosfomycin resistance hydrolase [Aestuariispira insulae]|uniref:Catechol 2,3-dioxygenase-like lactoylglutathione lyase family enzyme n=1 Tax=Aestuariispira insulae TaxID=1461337 RepID=A0A3D9H9J3_9PROT|nr:FosX/FosE/FosI family fosfomycin resistance hydrolase [Aestuariispira insulae]RED46158.1 catechol 2,3-dioxygenase-like lactoylglutathione lyase family enzyme [Aestuariispira insulae]